MFGAAGSIWKLVDLAEKVLTDTQLREKFEKNGRVSGHLKIEEYDLYFMLMRAEGDPVNE